MVWNSISAYYNRRESSTRRWRPSTRPPSSNPNNPQGYHLIGAYYQDKVQQGLPAHPGAEEGLRHEGHRPPKTRRSQLNPNYIEALLYKNILLRQQANLETDAAKQKELIQQADQLRNKAMEIQKGGGSAAAAAKAATGK